MAGITRKTSQFLISSHRLHRNFSCMYSLYFIFFLNSSEWNWMSSIFLSETLRDINIHSGSIAASSASHARVGFIGLGNMGTPMTLNLMKKVLVHYTELRSVHFPQLTLFLKGSFCCCLWHFSRSNEPSKKCRSCSCQQPSWSSWEVRNHRYHVAQ